MYVHMSYTDTYTHRDRSYIYKCIHTATHTQITQTYIDIHADIHSHKKREIIYRETHTYTDKACLCRYVCKHIDTNRYIYTHM